MMQCIEMPRKTMSCIVCNVCMKLCTYVCMKCMKVGRYEVYAMYDVHVQKLPTTCSAHFLYPVQLYIVNAYMYILFTYIYVHMH